MEYVLYYLDKELDSINLTSKQYAKKRFFECIKVRARKSKLQNNKKVKL